MPCAQRSLIPTPAERAQPPRAGCFAIAAILADKILKDASSGELPIEPPDRFELVINGRDREGAGPDYPTIASRPS
jgi:hypothetical protein